MPVHRSQEVGGFSFAVTAITALIAFLSAIYLYIQNTAVTDDLYGYVSLIIPIIIISILFFIAFIIIHGISIKVQDFAQGKLETLASIIYLSAFSMFAIISLLILSFIFLFKNLYNIYIIIALFFAFFLLLLTVYFSEYLEHLLISKATKFKLVLILIVLFVLLLLIWLFIPPLYIAIYIIFSTIILITLLVYRYIIQGQHSKLSPLVSVSLILISLLAIYFLVPTFTFFVKGDVIIDMESIYSKNRAPIHVSIQITGPNTGLSINLSNRTFDYNLTYRDSIKNIESTHNPNNIVHGDNFILFGNSLENGKYNVFIDTTNLSEGYYELMVNRTKYNDIYIKSFYLLNPREK